jgi:hypothetical protein
MFTWIPIYEEIAGKILAFENRQHELLELLGKLRAEGLKVIQLNDRDANDKVIPLAEIDPLTFFASFNRTSSVPGRQAILKRIKEAWNLTSPVPDDFTGIPLANAQNSWAFAYAADREPTDVPVLWRVAREAVDKDWRTFDQKLFNEALGISQMGLARMSMSLFWMKPRAYLSLDKNTRAFFEKSGIECDSKTAAGYVSWLEKVVAQAGDNFPQISHDAYLACSGDESAAPSDEDHAPFVSQLRARLAQGVPWTKDIEEFAAAFGNLNPDQVAQLPNEQLWKLWTATKFAQTGTPGLPTPNADQWSGIRRMTQLLCNRSQPLGERFDAARAVFRETFTAEQVQLPVLLRTLLILEGGRFGSIAAKSHLNPLLQWAGKPEMDYRNAASITSALESIGELIEEWAAKAGAKSLGERASIPWHLCKIIGGSSTQPDASSALQETYTPTSKGVAYWWLNANPKIWDIRGAPVGTVNTYTTHNEAGNKRQKYKHFLAVKPGDLVLGYVTSPEKEIVALCQITKGLHTTDEGEVIEFKKIEEFKQPVTWAELQSAPALKHCEPIESNQGSLFMPSRRMNLSSSGRSLTSATLVTPDRSRYRSLHQSRCARPGCSCPQPRLDLTLARLKQKKALVLQGPPGVGKTFVAKRLAYALMGRKDDRRVCMVQFHPSYGYEDFIQGYRPSRGGGLERRDGVFYEFARLARNDPEHDWFFIIDEINRGNLAKIFGELLMLLEADKRGPDHVVSLTYSEKGRAILSAQATCTSSAR